MNHAKLNILSTKLQESDRGAFGVHDLQIATSVVLDLV